MVGGSRTPLEMQIQAVRSMHGLRDMTLVQSQGKVSGSENDMLSPTMTSHDTLYHEQDLLSLYDWMQLFASLLSNWTLF